MGKILFATLKLVTTVGIWLLLVIVLLHLIGRIFYLLVPHSYFLTFQLVEASFSFL